MKNLNIGCSLTQMPIISQGRVNVGSASIHHNTVPAEVQAQICGIALLTFTNSELNKSPIRHSNLRKDVKKDSVLTILRVDPQFIPIDSVPWVSRKIRTMPEKSFGDGGQTSL